MGNLKAMIRDCIMMAKGKVNQVKRTQAVDSKLRLRNGSFRLPTWRRPIFNPDFLEMPVAGGRHTSSMSGRRLICSQEIGLLWWWWWRRRR